MQKLDACMKVSDMEGNKEQLNDQVRSPTPVAQVEPNHNGPHNSHAEALY